MLRLLICTICAYLASAQIRECPLGWVRDDIGQSCYKFVFEPETYETATRLCADMGSHMIAVNDANEFTFINNYLQINDGIRSQWLTSGEQDLTIAQLFRWMGDSSALNDNLRQFMASGGAGTILVFRFAGVEFRLGLAKVSDKLNYICEISLDQAYLVLNQDRDFRFGTYVTSEVDMLYGPQFTKMPEDVIMIQSSKQAYVECRAMGNPSPTYRWFRGDDERNINEEVSPSTSLRYTLTNGKLTIQKPNEEEDAGYYRCEVENKFGKIVSDPIQLSFGFLAEFSNVQDAPVPATAYDGAVVSCSDIKYKPDVVYNWMRQSYSGSGFEYIYTELMPYMFLSANGKLYFTEVTRVDQADYYCQVTLAGLSSTVVGSSQPPSKTSLPIFLSVSDSAARADWGPDIHNDFIAVFPKPPMRGEDLRLECFAYGSAKNYESSWSYSWSRAGKPLPARTKFTDLNRVLTIKDIQREDEGTYTCLVSRGNAASDSESVTVTLEARPYFLVPLRPQHIDEGAHLTWRCQAGGRPIPYYTWYRNGVEITSSTPDMTVNKNILTITNANSDAHNGMYQCSATNIHGTSFSGAQLRVYSFTPTFSKSPMKESQDAAIRGNMTLSCNPEGAPKADIEWLKNGNMPLSTGGNIEILINGDLHISNINTNDGGFYTCKAINIHGEAVDSTRVNIRTGTTMNRILAPKMDVNLNDTAFLRCEASYDPVLDLMYAWKFNGRELDIANDVHYTLGTHSNSKGLYIKNVQFKHEGQYECVARTPLNEAVSIGELNVLGPPGECGGVFADPHTVTTSTIMLYWFPGDDNGRPIDYYIIQAEAVIQPDVWVTVRAGVSDIETVIEGNSRDMRNILVSGLDPGNGYRFRVQAANAYGIGIYSKPSQVYQTKPAPPSRAPSSVNGGGGSVGDLTMTWRILARVYRGGPNVRYIVYWRAYSNDPNRQWSMKEISNVNTTRYTHQVGDTNFYMKYEVKVQAFNDYGKGPNSTEVIIYSAEGLPAAAPEKVNAEGFNSTAMEVYWTQVANTRIAMKGLVRGYQINYWANNNEDPPLKQFIRYQGQRDTGLVIGLAADSYFWFDVQVYNTAGLGPLSEKYTQETKNPAPFLYPQETHVHSQGAEAVKITWRGISTSVSEDTLRGYMVYYWQANENFRTATEVRVDRKPTEYILQGLKKNIVYAVRIAGYSGGGAGKKSPTVFFTLGGMVYVDPTLTEIRASAAINSSSFVYILCIAIVTLLLQK
ncbi:contactin-like [Pecten maximus]|uniref:contactin-like n=1 Tax=Pecten maximus TaxID=6579 RepID=UPI0014585C64|nr:contactin-like [Pecten maximus]